MFVDAFTITIKVVWVYTRWNINFAFHLWQFIPYCHFHPFSCLKCSRLMKGLNTYNNVTEWDNWFVYIAYIFGPGYFSMRQDIFLPYFFLCIVFFYWNSIDVPVFWGFFWHFIFGKVWLLLFNTILNILIGFQSTCFVGFVMRRLRCLLRS